LSLLQMVSEMWIAAPLYRQRASTSRCCRPRADLAGGRPGHHRAPRRAAYRAI